MSAARSRIRRGSTSSDLGVGVEQVEQHVLVVGEPRQPRLHAVEGQALGQALPLLAPPRLAAHERLGPLAAPRRWAAAHGTGRSRPRLEVDRSTRWSATENSVSRSTSSPHRSMRTGHVGGRREDVDDRAAHGDLAAVLDLVLAAVAAPRRGGRRARSGRRRRRGRRRSARRPRRGGRVAGRAPAPARRRPAERARARRGRRHIVRRRRPMVSTVGADPLERQRLPCREQVDLVGAEEGGEVVVPGARRRPWWAWPRRSGGGRRRDGEAGHRDGPGRLGHGEHRAGAAEHLGQRRLVAQ